MALQEHPTNDGATLNGDFPLNIVMLDPSEPQATCNMAKLQARPKGKLFHPPGDTPRPQKPILVVAGKWPDQSLQDSS